MYKFRTYASADMDNLIFDTSLLITRTWLTFSAPCLLLEDVSMDRLNEENNPLMLNLVGSKLWARSILPLYLIEMSFSFRLKPLLIRFAFRISLTWKVSAFPGKDSNLTGCWYSGIGCTELNEWFLPLLRNTFEKNIETLITILKIQMYTFDK